MDTDFLMDGHRQIVGWMVDGFDRFLIITNYHGNNMMIRRPYERRTHNRTKMPAFVLASVALVQFAVGTDLASTPTLKQI